MNNMIGNTPLLSITYRYKGEERIIYAKAEFYNLTGSIKDRMAQHIIMESYKDGTLQRGMPIIEATSGNTGIAFSALGAMYEHPVHIFMPEWMTTERKQMIRKYGATLHEVTKEQGGFEGCVLLANQLAESINGFRPQQFYNPYNMDAHFKTTGLEICTQLDKLGVIPDAFVAGVGTGGTIMGVGKRLHVRYPHVKLFPVEPAQSPVMSTGNKGLDHRIQGIGDGFIPELIDMRKLDEVIVISDGDAIIMAQLLAKKLGLGVGISSGANFLAAVSVQNKYGKDFNVITVFSDDSKKYLSSDLTKIEPIQEGYYSPHIELIEMDGECICDVRIHTGTCVKFMDLETYN
ncbi:PLP-dependent cysteine synthase family protein [Candidatus Xianfuyuplasma coldseepsis]|uniref:cysteine synthase n=1 Tax=Candidatus Xianfuyuplasma coldseepsis TaxID=2782163 RepID=A0A7L7KNZ5_9MOLU|nr:cysteine synthase family protein [Xianfuyuplasma coldseepsis]QMS84387.1 cysteine synthase family protein [Xianfuyuplasma coldseepsis]